jgi:hypothetical protein
VPAVATITELRNAVATHQDEPVELKVESAALDAARAALDSAGMLLGEVHGVRFTAVHSPAAAALRLHDDQLVLDVPRPAETAVPHHDHQNGAITL